MDAFSSNWLFHVSGGWSASYWRKGGSYEKRDGKKILREARWQEEVVRLVVAAPDIVFTPFFFYMMELILRNFNMTGIVEAILDVLEGYDEFRI